MEDRETLSNRNAWKVGFTPQAEIWNGRLAMLGFVVALGIQLVSSDGVLGILGL